MGLEKADIENAFISKSAFCLKVDEKDLVISQKGRPASAGDSSKYIISRQGFSISYHCTSRIARKYFFEHCRIFDCEAQDVSSYIMSCLGYTAMTLDHFPFKIFIQMTEDCCDFLDKIGF